MSTKEEIRNAIDIHTDDGCLYPDKNCAWCSKEGYCASDNDSYTCLMKRLGELGVVIKVDREPYIVPPTNSKEELEAQKERRCPYIRMGEYFNTLFCGLDQRYSQSAHKSYMAFCEYQNGGRCNPTKKYKKLKAGYVAVEPLI